jgi:hypothetical protein
MHAFKQKSLVVFQDTFPFTFLQVTLYKKLGPIVTNETKVAMVVTMSKIGTIKCRNKGHCNF